MVDGLHVNLLIVVVNRSCRHVTGSDPGIFYRLCNLLLASDLDASPVENQEDGDGGPDGAAQEAAAETHLQSKCNRHQWIHRSSPSFGSSMSKQFII